ncbi:hypothetical protein SLE2022_391820 [Rubroshorea leprosula]
MLPENQRFSILLYAIFILLKLFLLHCYAAIYNITSSNPLSQNEILISPTQVFELGLFCPDNTTNQYVGIWYKNIAPRTVVWVANRENPVIDSLASLKIGSDGNLKLVDGNEVTLWSTNVSVRSNSSVAVLLDNGNFVLQDGLSEQQLWQSFEHPGNTLLPGAGTGYDRETGERRVLSSWKSNSDPSRGDFVTEIVPRSPPQALIWNGSVPHWRSGEWNKLRFIGLQGMDSTYSRAISLVLNDDQESGYFYISLNTTDTSIAILSEGTLKIMSWRKDTGWYSTWKRPNNACDVYGTCGPFGICKISEFPICSCLEGFVPKSDEEWNKNNWTGGCVRRTELSCLAKTSLEASQGEETDRFWKMNGIKLPDKSKYQDVKDVNECGQWCLNNCSCKAYAYVMNIGCLLWSEDLIDMQELSSVFLAHRKLRVDLIISLTTVSCTIILGALVYGLCWQRSKKIGKKGRTSENFDPDARRESPRDIFLESTFRSIVKKGEPQGLPLFDFDSIVVATNNFSMANKLGQGGYGPVYKGKLYDGTDIAVKRLSSSSRQGIEEFKNEVGLISKLQHRNLVRLVGCCVEGEERILIYEFLANKSLDNYLFDPTKRAGLSWAERFNIIQGIARGLLYLHRDSCLRVIHRDLKVGNILLDDKMNPKISDFGLARIFEGTQNLANTHKVVGTFGYMSPEYALGGIFSEKSDVFSFGVLLLEIVSGKKVTRFLYDNEHLSLLSHAWQLWSKGQELDLIDDALADSFSSTEVKRCIQVALLCVQDHAENRPTMAAVISMLSSETELLQPKEPIFTFHNPSKFDQPRDNNPCSICEITLSLAEGR